MNTGNDSTVDEKALEVAVKNGHIHAILDVFETEPLPQDSKLRGLDNVILMPHMAGPTMDRFPRVGMALVEDIKNWLTDKPLANEITRENAANMTA